MAFSAVLDTCVLVLPTSRDLLLECASAGGYRALWSDETEAELERTIEHLWTRKRRDAIEARGYATRLLRSMNGALPDARVTGWQLAAPAAADLPDPGDAHVIGAAIRGGAAVVVTLNLKDFPANALPAGLSAQHPDEFLRDLLDLVPGLVGDAVERISARTGRRGPKLSVEEVLGALEQEGLTGFASDYRERAAN